MITPGKPIRASSYCRLSLAAMGDTTKVDDQDAVNHKLAAARDWTIDSEHVYKDNSMSAWRRDRKRPGWQAMLGAIERNELDAVIIYHGDRLVRQPRDMEDLLDLGAPRGLLLLSPTGQYNLADPDHQMMLRWMVARAKNEVDHMSRRMKDGHERRRKQGIVRAGGRGGRAFGFAKDNLTPVEREAALVREAADRVLAADGLTAICDDWTRRGVVTTTGRPFEYGTLKKMLMRPRYAGLMPDRTSPAAWRPVYDGDPDRAREIWEAVCATLEGKTLTFRPTNARTHLLSGIALCGTCEEPVAIRHNTRGKQLLGYGCINKACRRKLHRAVIYVDGRVIGAVLELLGDADFIASLRTPGDPGLAREIGVLEARKSAVQGQLEHLVDHPSLSPDLLARALAGFDERIADLRGRIAMSVRARLLAAHAGLSEPEWHRLSLQTRKALVRACFTVTILPTAKRGPGFDPESVRLDPVED